MRPTVDRYGTDERIAERRCRGGARAERRGASCSSSSTSSRRSSPCAATRAERRLPDEPALRGDLPARPGGGRPRDARRLYPRLAEFPAFAQLAQSHQVLVRRWATEELRDVILEPAYAVGLIRRAGPGRHDPGRRRARAGNPAAAGARAAGDVEHRPGTCSRSRATGPPAVCTTRWANARRRSTPRCPTRAGADARRVPEAHPTGGGHGGHPAPGGGQRDHDERRRRRSRGDPASSSARGCSRRARTRSPASAGSRSRTRR